MQPGGKVITAVIIFLAAACLLAASGLSTASARAGDDGLPKEARIKGVRGRPQSYSLSCESRSAVDWAAFWGVEIGEGEFLQRLPRSDNPEAGFVGNPNDAWGFVPPYSYGVHAKPVAALLRRFGLQAQARRGLGWNEARGEIAAGRPLIVWIIGEMWPGQPQRYTARDGRTVTVASYEHTNLLIGYDAQSVTVIDAYTGQARTYPLRQFLTSWETLGRMAVTGGQPSAPGSGGVPEPPAAEAPPSEAQPPTPAPEVPALNVQLYLPQVHSGTPDAAVEAKPRPKSRPALADTYRVRPGDTLASIALRFGLDWRELARINGVAYPYVIYTGQVLRLR
jgi:uncharacterized protein YvpB